MKKFALGADVGGSHISVILVDLEKEVILKDCKSCSKVDNKASAEEILNTWKCAIENSISGIDRNQLSGIGLAMPGPFDYQKGIALFTEEVNKFEKLFGVNVQLRLQQLLNLSDDIAIRFINDATAFAIGDAWKGKSRDSNKTIAITLGTGLGAAFIESGIPVLERDDVPDKGCLYHLPYKESIANEYFCTGWFIKEYVKKTGRTVRGVKEMASEASANSELIDIFNEFGDNLGAFLIPWIQKFNPNCLLLGGNIAKAFNLFGPSFSSVLKNKNLRINVEVSEQMENSAMMGSARLMDEDFWKQIQPLLPMM